jgi:DNA-binding winged helix-turn-helix (wHTH) protein/tetratricopeptide (TPR) repeat protein
MQATESSLGTLRFGVFEVDVRAAELRKHGVRIKLQEQPFQILALLLKRPGELVTREELRQELWPAHTFVDFDRGLNKAMTKLRSALGDSAESPRYIETLHRRGYRFLAPLTEQLDDSSHFIVAHTIEHRTHENMIEQEEAPVIRAGRLPLIRAGRSLRANIAVAAAVVVICVSGLLYLRMYHPVVFGSTAAELGARRSVAVLGFKNLSGNVQDAWLSTALSDWLITELSAGDQLRTIPPESVARMKMELSLPDVQSIGGDSLARIRKNLGTDYVVAGSYAMLGGESGEQMRLDLRLQDARTGETVAAVSESGTESHLFDLVANAGEKLRSTLGVGAITTAEAAEVATSLPSNSEASRLYWGGLARLRVFDALAAHDLLQKAVAAEPTFALSHSALANAWSQLGYDAKANAEAKRAFDLSVNLSRAERLLVEGRYREMSRDWGKAIEIYRALFEFFPDNLDYGLALASAQVNAGRGTDALDTVAALRSLPSPLRDDARIDLVNGHASESLGDFKTVQTVTARAAEKASAAGASLLLAKARLDQSWAFENLGEFDQVDGLVREAKQLYEAAHDRKGAADAVTLGAIALEMRGDYPGAKKEYEESLAIYTEIGGRLNVANETDNMADILLGLGDLSGARKNYEAALAIYQEIGHPDGIPLAKSGLGDVFLTLGKHEEAKQMFEESLEVCRRIGDRSKAGVALSGLGRVYRVEGDLEAARKNASDAKAVFREIGDKAQEAETDLQLAQILLDEGKTAAAVAAARGAAGEFEQTRALRDQAASNLVLSRALLAEGKVAEARASIDMAIAAANQSQLRELILFASVTSDRVRAASLKPGDEHDAASRLNDLAKEATAAGLVNVAMEARLARGEIEMTSGNRAAGSAQLEELQRDAESGGYRLMAQRAAAILHGAREQAAL